MEGWTWDDQHAGVALLWKTSPGSFSVAGRHGAGMPRPGIGRTRVCHNRVALRLSVPPHLGVADEAQERRILRAGRVTFLAVLPTSPRPRPVHCSVPNLAELGLTTMTGDVWLDPVAGFINRVFTVRESRESWEFELVEDNDHDDR